MSEEILSLALRPKRLSELVGQETLVKAIRKQFTTRSPHAIMLTGGTGSGKTTIARIIAVSLQCEHQKEWGEPCDHCSESYSAFSIHEVNASDDRGVEDFGKIAELARYSPNTGKQRVIILDECQKASGAAQNLLLKPTEDVPPTTTWIIATTDPVKIIATLRRRFLNYSLAGLDATAAEALVSRAAKDIGCKLPMPAFLSKIEEENITSPALILMALEKYSSGLTVEQATSQIGSVGVNIFSICQAMGAGRSKELRRLLQTVSGEEAYGIRASTLGYLRGMFWRESQPTRLVSIGDSMKELSDGRAPMDQNLLYNWLIPTLYKITKRFTV